MSDAGRRVAATATDDLDAAQTELLALLVAEFGEGGIETEVVPAADGAPPQLVYPIGSDPAGRHLRVHAYFVPGIDEPAALQYFSALPYEIDTRHVAAVAQFVCRLNADLPVTGFELAVPGTDAQPGATAVAFRHTHAVNVRPLDPGVIAWTLSMAAAAITTFGEVLEGVGSTGDLEAAFAAADRILDSLDG